MEVKLTFSESVMSCLVGAMRHFEAIYRGREARFPERYPDQLLLHHIHGAAAECAFSKCTDQYWGGHVNRFHKPDVGEVEVRFSNGGSLKVRPDDDCWVALISGGFPRFTFCGAIHAGDAKRSEWLKDPGGWGAPAYFVPESELQKKVPDEEA
jgi:hypothetical protein|tara:strand:+ start:214 stop:672 length:459 start_codon:yes stop_codon:yes gene_type:complete